MTELFLSPAVLPFSIALGVVLGLLALELVAALVGGSLIMGGSDTEVDVDLDADVEADFEAHMDAADGASGALSWLGLGQVPMMIWLAVFLTLFGLGGLILQSVLRQMVGFELQAGLASLAAAVPALGITGRVARGFAALIPKFESSAMSENHLGRTRGIISQGTAARGRPAEVRVIDRHGNTHYLRAEPLRDDAQFAQGTEVLVLRKSLHEGYRLVALSD